MTAVLDGAVPVVPPGLERGLRALAAQTRVETWRLLVRLCRNPVALLFLVLMPIGFTIALDIVLGDRISAVTGHSALYGSVPMNAVATAVNGSMVVAVGLASEQTSGLLSRLWVLPVHRASGLLARTVAEAVRIPVTTAVLLGVGAAMGFRFHQGWLGVVGWFLVPVIFGLPIAMLITTVALYWAKTPLVEAVELVLVLAILFSTGFIPLSGYPRWVQPLVEHQPLTYTIEAMRGMSVGGPVLSPMIGVLLWSGGIAAACLYPMVRGYRRASTR
jgi:ABC-2 type transport system permease protein